MGTAKEAKSSSQNFKSYVGDVLIVLLIAVAITGLVGRFLLGWTAWYQFAEGLTLGAALVMMIGASGPMGYWRQTRSLPYQYASTRTDVELYDRMRNENREAKNVYSFMYVFFGAGLAMIGLAMLIHRLIR
jgi:hypothetical protein